MYKASRTPVDSGPQLADQQLLGSCQQEGRSNAKDAEGERHPYSSQSQYLNSAHMWHLQQGLNCLSERQSLIKPRTRWRSALL